MKKILHFDNILYYNISFINGNVFYAIEYLYYLKKDFYLIIKIPSINIKNKIIKLWKEKYNNKINEIQDKIFFILNQKVITKNCLLLDGYSINDYNKNLFTKNIIYNYGDHEKSLKISFRNSKIITIGDKEIGCNVEYHYPLFINFSLFKELNDLNIKKDIFIEDKRDNSSSDIYKRKRNIKNFHEQFNHLIYYKENFWERANRLIPECKFYSKKINFYNYDNFLDSADLRYRRKYEYYDINKSNIKEWFYEQFKIY